MKKIFAILPCYNEQDNIGALIDGFMAEREKLSSKGKYVLSVVAIDDCSTDDTKQVILGCAARYEGVSLLAHESNKGLCGGLNSAIAYFMEHGEEDSLLLLMDGDNTHDPAYLHEMLRKIEAGSDCVIASRYRAGADVVGVARHRVFMSDMAKHYYRAVLRVPNVQDYTCGYRLYKRDSVQRMVSAFGQDPIKEKSFACMMELLYKLYLTGARFDEVGFVLRYDNKQGASKMQVLRTARKSITTALRLRRLKKSRRGAAHETGV